MSHNCSLPGLCMTPSPSYKQNNLFVYCTESLTESTEPSSVLTVCIRSPGRVRPGSHPSKLFMVLKVSDRGRSQPTESDSECQPHGSDQSEASIGAPLTNQRPGMRGIFPADGHSRDYQQQSGLITWLRSHSFWGLREGLQLTLETMAQSVGCCKPS